MVDPGIYVRNTRRDLPFRCTHVVVTKVTRPIHFQTPGERHVELMPFSDHDLDNLSQITEDDMDRAQSFWQRRLPKSLRDLLSAVVSALHLA